MAGLIQVDVGELREGAAGLRVAGAHELRRHLVEREVVGGQVVADVADVADFDQHVAAAIRAGR